MGLPWKGWWFILRDRYLLWVCVCFSYLQNLSQHHYSGTHRKLDQQIWIWLEIQHYSKGGVEVGQAYSFCWSYHILYHPSFRRSWPQKILESFEGMSDALAWRQLCERMEGFPLRSSTYIKSEPFLWHRVPNRKNIQVWEIWLGHWEITPGAFSQWRFCAFCPSHSGLEGLKMITFCQRPQSHPLEVHITSATKALETVCVQSQQARSHHPVLRGSRNVCIMGLGEVCVQPSDPLWHLLASP